MISSFRKALAVLLLLCMAAGLSAFSGIPSLFETFSGQYVYYRDYIFEEETYIGFLQYDEYTYAIRYYSPIATNGRLPAIEMYITLNPDVDYVEITGEKINSPVSENDLEMMNYMHDMIYELGARRRHVADADMSTTVSVSEEFTQFGGTVTLNWDYFIPVFNLRSITDQNGEILLETISVGMLKDSYDSSFSTFSGVTDIPLIDDYYIAGIPAATARPELTPINDQYSLVGAGAILRNYSQSFAEEDMTAEERQELADALATGYFYTIQSVIYSFFLNDYAFYLPETTVISKPAEGSIRALYLVDLDSDGNKDAAYLLMNVAVTGTRLTLKQLLISVDQYYSDTEFYESLISL